MKRGAKNLIFVLYLVFGLYFLNLFFGFVNLDDIVFGIEKWINLVGGILLIIGGLFSLKPNRGYY